MEVRKRKARFSVHEIDVLVDEVYRNRATLFSRLCSTITNEKKMVIWQSITEKVNEVCTVQPRTADEVRRKWYYYLSDRKKEVSRRNKLKKTDCHSPDVIYNQTDLKILELLGEIDGVDRTVEGAVEGLICEVDADALPIRPSSASSYFNEHEEHQEGSRTSSGEVLASRLPDHPLATQACTSTTTPSAPPSPSGRRRTPERSRPARSERGRPARTATWRTVRTKSSCSWRSVGSTCRSANCDCSMISTSRCRPTQRGTMPSSRPSWISRGRD
nr:myb/SANT-like DNA-binding domain-containing protein 4 isoform X2 [Procambarus clarkii]